MRKEWNALRERKAWSEHLVREWKDVSAEAKAKNLRIHVGRIFGICVEKNRELTPDDPRRKYKGRVVFQGNNVRDEDHFQAVFQDLGSAPATMLAARIADFVALLPGCSGEVADAVRAYIQAKLTGVPTWIRIPREEWPSAWAKMRDPVVPLHLALYGHPDAGTCWERHCDVKLREKGFLPVSGWPGCYTHKSLAVFLTVYVDDFKMSGKDGDRAKAWKLIKEAVDLEDPEPYGRYLGCGQEIGEATPDSDVLMTCELPGVEKNPTPSTKVRTMKYDMSPFIFAVP
jgi:hypothetical protein